MTPNGYIECFTAETDHEYGRALARLLIEDRQRRLPFLIDGWILYCRIEDAERVSNLLNTL